MSLTNSIAEGNSVSPDELLVSECLEGSEEAWGALIDKYRNLIYSIPIRYGLSRDDASDIFQEVCLILLAELPRLRDPRTLTAWLIQVTSRKTMKWVRKEARNAANPWTQYTLDQVASPQVDGIDHDGLFREQLLRETVTELPIRCQHLIRMLFFTAPSVPYAQAARLLGLATGSVGFIRMRCLGKLRRMMEQKGLR